jgi:hypothetical protein
MASLAGNVFCVVLLLTIPGVAVANDPTARGARAELDAAFQQRLDVLANKCAELGLADQAEQTRNWCVQRDGNRQYAFLASNDDAAKPAANAPQLVHQWHAKFMAFRREYAAELWESTEASVLAGRGAEAYRMAHEVLYHDPEHAAARRLLGYRRVGQRWALDGAATRTIAGRVEHPDFGWRRNRYWRVESPHFRITTNANPKVAREMAARLEDLFVVWRQVFFLYWSTPQELRQQLKGTSFRPEIYDKHDIVLFRDRDEYLARLSPYEPQIELTLGYYSKDRQTALFYAADPSLISTWYHETTHQLFQECGPAVAAPGEDANFWIVEGAALYMESLALQPGYATLGGFESARLQYARARRLTGDFVLPFAEIVTLGREPLQQHPDLRKLYSRATGGAHLLMDFQQGRYRDALVKYLTLVYLGRDSADTLSQLTETTYEQLDADYVEFLNVSDRDLEQLPIADTPMRQLWLAGTDVTDRGLSELEKHDLRQIEWLDFSSTRIGDPGIASVRGATSLRRLYVGATAISDLAMETIRRLPQIEELDLSQTAITDAGLSHLETMSRLKLLWLTGTPITDAAIARLGQLERLERLDVRGTNVTNEACQRLREKRPRLELITDFPDSL